jgi:hypothetical protein
MSATPETCRDDGEDARHGGGDGALDAGHDAARWGSVLTHDCIGTAPPVSLSMTAARSRLGVISPFRRRDTMDGSTPISLAKARCDMPVWAI